MERLYGKRVDLDALCDQIDRAFRRLITVHGSSEDEVYRLVHPPTARELQRREDIDRLIVARIKSGRIELPADKKARKQEKERLLPNPYPPRKSIQRTRDGRLRWIGRERHLLTLLRAEIWSANKRRLARIEKTLSAVDLAGLRREVARHHGRVIGGTVKALGGHPDHYDRKVMVVRLQRQHPGQRLSLKACARLIADRAKGTRLTFDEILKGLNCRRCPDPPGYRDRSRGRPG